MKDELVLKNRPKSNISEDIRTIRTNLQFLTKKSSQVLLVTSSIQGEGKSFISSNLALAFAQAGEKVLLIDSDLRLGRVHKIFNVSNVTGLSSLLAEDELKEISKKILKTNIENLYVIPRGIVPPNPSELLSSDNTKKLIKSLKTKFDRVIFDGVPINGLPDSLIVAGLADRTILVTAVGTTSIDELTSTTKALEKINANVAGIVANRIAATKRGKYSYYYSNYYTEE